MVTEAVYVNKEIKLKRARAQVRLSQTELARLAHVGRQAVMKAEQGDTISQISAWAILNALNKVREASEMKPLEFDEMDWSVQGEK